MSTPKRIQRKRTKGWRMPPDAVYVGRPSKWGNDFKVGYYPGAWWVTVPGGEIYFGSQHEARAGAVDAFRRTLAFLDLDPLELRGRDLVCWCPLDQPCHADVLLEIANRP